MLAIRHCKLRTQIYPLRSEADILHCHTCEEGSSPLVSLPASNDLAQPMAPMDQAHAIIAKITPPPPPGSPYAVPIPGSERENRTAVYRHWRFRDTPLLETFEPTTQTFNDLFEIAVNANRNKNCLGWRPWNSATRTWENKYVWMTFAEVAERRKNFGAGIVEVNQRAGVTADKFPVGIWAQNCPNWQVTGEILRRRWT